MRATPLGLRELSAPLRNAHAPGNSLGSDSAGVNTPGLATPHSTMPTLCSIMEPSASATHRLPATEMDTPSAIVARAPTASMSSPNASTNTKSADIVTVYMRLKCARCASHWKAVGAPRPCGATGAGGSPAPAPSQNPANTPSATSTGSSA